VEELFADAVSVRDGRGLWLALDRIQDPHNVGAIFRAAAFFGVAGLLVTRDQSAPLSQTVYDVASGGIEHVPFSSPPNLSRALKTAKKAGLWILGTSEHGETGVGDVPRDRPWILVLGNEESGLRRLTLEQCDCVCALSAAGPVKSLNVSVAAGVLMSQLTSFG
jgi:23S rRNA (guanosine2251-2'-O)-methyltransferase